MLITKRMLFPAVLMCLLLDNGCSNLLGVIASKAPRPDIQAAYQGLANHSVGVLIWADRSLLMDWPNLPLDMSTSVVSKLQAAQKDKVKDVLGVTYPYPPASYVKYQKDHPEIGNLPITTVAEKLGIDRLIYIEVNDLSTRSDNGVALYLGRMDCTLKIVEVKDGLGKIAYEEDGIRVQFPEKAPKEGLLAADDRKIYAGSLDSMTTAITKRLLQHADDSEDKGGF